jgi:hypothetical protein
MISNTLATITAGVLLLANSGAASGGQNVVAPTARAQHVRVLLGSARWSSREGRRQYLAIKDAITSQVLQEIDGVIVESVSPKSMSLVAIRAVLDGLLDHKRGDLQDSLAFDVTLPNGRFLLIGVEIARGGGAISENAISFRAYRATGDRFVFVSHVEYSHEDLWHDGSEPLASINARPLSQQPIATQWWFAAWAAVPSLAPPTITVRLFAFDGEGFTIVWKRADFTSSYVTDAVRVTPGGFVISRIPDHLDNRVINESYAVTADGPQKVTESEALLR